MKISRRRFLAASLAAGSLAFPAPFISADPSPSNKIRVGILGCGVRARDLLGTFSSIPEAEVTAICDPDSARLDEVAGKHNIARKFSDPRELIELNDIDVVVAAVCNHWHCLAAVLAMQAGKDVYVEKPLAHNQWEGAQVVKAARKYDRICQVGMQQRSDPMQAEVKKFLHEEKAIGNLLCCRVNHYSVRVSIGKRSTPLEFPETVNKDIWLGPAADEPIYREKLQYDWHWDWNTGNGEMGNWGIHVLDDVRNVVLRDQVALPKRVMAGGARVIYDDAGQTPNMNFVYYDTDVMPVVFGMSNLQANDNPKSAGAHPGPGSGHIVYGEGGRLEGRRGGSVAYDADGKEIRRFKGTGGQAEHVRNFLDAVVAHDRSILNAEAEVGNDSCGWCNVTNIASRIGHPYDKSQTKAVPESVGIWNEVITGHEELLKTYDTTMEELGFKLSPMLEIEDGKFLGEDADKANALLKRTFRGGFEFPEV